MDQKRDEEKDNLKNTQNKEITKRVFIPTVFPKVVGNITKVADVAPKAEAVAAFSKFAPKTNVIPKLYSKINTHSGTKFNSNFVNPEFGNIVKPKIKSNVPDIKNFQNVKVIPESTIVLTPVGAGICHCVDVANNFLETIGPYATGFGVVVSVCQIVNAGRTDIKTKKKLGKNTAVTTVLVIASWSGAYIGGLAGAEIGTIVGTVIGSLFGPVGIVPGAAVGCILGGIAGNLSGNYAATKGTLMIFDKVVGPGEIKEPERSIIMYISSKADSNNFVIYGIDKDNAELFLLKETDDDLFDVLKTLPNSFKARLKAMVFNIQNFKYPEQLHQQEFKQSIVEIFESDNIPCYFIDETLLRLTALIIAANVDINFGESLLILNINENMIEVYELYCKEGYYEITAVRIIVCEDTSDSNTIRERVLENSQASFILVSQLSKSEESNMLMEIIRGIILFDKDILTCFDNYKDYLPHSIIMKAKLTEICSFDIIYSVSLLNSVRIPIT